MILRRAMQLLSQSRGHVWKDWDQFNLAKVKLISGVDIPLIGMGIGYDFTAYG